MLPEAGGVTLRIRQSVPGLPNCLGKNPAFWEAGTVALATLNMSVWEYKVITSGKGGFATPALLESFLNQLGRDEWEIVAFRQLPDNALAFTGLARRPTQRDWTLEDAVAAAARTEADKLRAEFEAKFKGAGAAPEERVTGMATAHRQRPPSASESQARREGIAFTEGVGRAPAWQR